MVAKQICSELMCCQPRKCPAQSDRKPARVRVRPSIRTDPQQQQQQQRGRVSERVLTTTRIIAHHITHGSHGIVSPARRRQQRQRRRRRLQRQQRQLQRRWRPAATAAGAYRTVAPIIGRAAFEFNSARTRPKRVEATRRNSPSSTLLFVGILCSQTFVPVLLRLRTAGAGAGVCECVRVGAHMHNTHTHSRLIGLANYIMYTHTRARSHSGPNPGSLNPHRTVH